MQMRRSRVSDSVLRVCPGARRAESASFFLARDPARQLAILLGQFEQALAGLRLVFHFGQRLEPVACSR
jgi:hypothetical protein